MMVGKQLMCLYWPGDGIQMDIRKSLWEAREAVMIALLLDSEMLQINGQKPPHCQCGGLRYRWFQIESASITCRCRLTRPCAPVFSSIPCGQYSRLPPKPMHQKPQQLVFITIYIITYETFSHYRPDSQCPVANDVLFHGQFWIHPDKIPNLFLFFLKKKTILTIFLWHICLSWKINNALCHRVNLSITWLEERAFLKAEIRNLPSQLLF